MASIKRINHGRSDLAAPSIATAIRFGLRIIDLSNLKLKNIPKALWTAVQRGQLKLEAVDLSNNQIQKVPRQIASLGDLKSLNLANNKIQRLPAVMRSLKTLQVLDLRGNPVKGLPPSITAEVQDPRTILDYFFSSQRGHRPLQEVKLILVGHGEVGKTTLAHRLTTGQFAHTLITQGIEIRPWRILTKKGWVRVNIWDFGGQEIMHATHQFFLTERTVYILVIEGRTGMHEQQTEYWLRMIRSRAGTVPVLVVLTKFDLCPFKIDKRKLREKYPEIRGFVEVDSQTGKGIDKLKIQLRKTIQSVKHVQEPFPEEWWKVKEKMAKMDQNYMPWMEFCGLCKANGVSDSREQESLAKTFHCLGLALNFRGDDTLQETSVLNPHWVVDGIYRIINCHELQEARRREGLQAGEFRIADMARILPESAYPQNMLLFLVELMRKFELCFPLSPDDNNRPKIGLKVSAGLKKDDRYLMPELLSRDQPELQGAWNPKDCLVLRYQYEVLPQGILPRFIVRTRALSDNNPRWRNGVVLSLHDCEALVRADSVDGRIDVLVRGPHIGKARRNGQDGFKLRRKLLGLIREEFRTIHSSLQALQPDELVSPEGQNEPAIPYELLRQADANGIESVSVLINKKIRPVAVEPELERLEPMTARHKPERRLKVFYSYAEEDERLRDRLGVIGTILCGEGLIQEWHDKKLPPAAAWHEEISRELRTADIVLFLMSQFACASSYIRNFEAPEALSRHSEKACRIVPIILRPCNWRAFPSTAQTDDSRKRALVFGDLQVLPRNGRAVTEWPNRDLAWKSIEDGLRALIDPLVFPPSK